MSACIESFKKYIYVHLDIFRGHKNEWKIILYMLFHCFLLTNILYFFIHAFRARFNICFMMTDIYIVCTHVRNARSKRVAFVSCGYVNFSPSYSVSKIRNINVSLQAREHVRRVHAVGARGREHMVDDDWSTAVTWSPSLPTPLLDHDRGSM